MGLAPDEICVSDIDESQRVGELPSAVAGRLAIDKARSVASIRMEAYVLAADTVVACGRRILPKAIGVTEARECLNLLSGRRHNVYTGVAIIDPRQRLKSRIVKSTVAFKRLAPNEIEHYLESREWEGKAGGYAIQGRGALFVRWLKGSYSAVVGLPLYETGAILNGLGYPVVNNR